VEHRPIPVALLRRLTFISIIYQNTGPTLQRTQSPL